MAKVLTLSPSQVTLLADIVTRRNIAGAQYDAAIAVLLAGAGVPAATPHALDFAAGTLALDVPEADPPAVPAATDD